MDDRTQTDGIDKAKKSMPEKPSSAADIGGAGEGSSAPDTVAAEASLPPAASPVVNQRRPGSLQHGGSRMLRFGATALVLLAAAVAALLIWDYYVVAPWTRDGRIRVQVANVAPQVSGQVTELRVVDNQFVHKGDVLYVIDQFDFQNALDQAKAQVETSAADYQVKRAEAERRQKLTDLATTPEQQQQYVGQATEARASFKSAQAKQAMAEINLDRTSVRSPVTGFVTNFQMRVGDYAREGSANLSVIDSESYWVDGYFEETKMAHVCIGDRVEAQLMGYRQPILGVIDSVTRGIAVSDAAASTQGLPNVDPIYTWVRLAQRVPVRVRITDVPPGVPLVSGMTATVSVLESAADVQSPWLQRRAGLLVDRITALYTTPSARPGCVPLQGLDVGHTVTLPTPRPGPAQSPGQINPGLAPGITQSPEPR